jgi:hypothetical protein
MGSWRRSAPLDERRLLKGARQLTRSHFTDAHGAQHRLTAPPIWVSDSVRLMRAHALAAEAHGGDRRASDRATFLEHVTEVGGLLHDAGCDDRLVAAGLLHDAVERGTLRESGLRDAMGDEISSVVMALTEDAAIESFSERKRALREQVRGAADAAVTIFAADKLSDIRGLARGTELFGETIEARLGTTVETMAGHYEDSVRMIEERQPDCVFLPALRTELEQLRAVATNRTLSHPGFVDALRGGELAPVTD